MNLTGTRPWVIGAVVAAVLMAGVTWLLVVGPTRSDIATLRDDTAAARTQNDVLAARASALEAQAADRAGLEAGVQTALQAIPSSTDLPAFNREIAQHAAERGIQVTSISVAAATGPGNVAADPAGLLAVPVTLEATGSRLALLYFLRDLQEVGPRAALVTSVSVGTAEGDTTTGSTGTEGTGSTLVDETETIGNTIPTTMTAQVTVFAHALSDQDSTLLADVVGTPDAG